jgi:hypothetical protein
VLSRRTTSGAHVELAERMHSGNPPA